MDVRDKVAELYPFNGSDPGMIIALRSAFRAGVDWYAEAIDDGLWEEVLRLRGQLGEARNAWWSATEQGDNGLIYTDRIEDAMDDIWSAIGHADWQPDQHEQEQ